MTPLGRLGTLRRPGRVVLSTAGIAHFLVSFGDVYLFVLFLHRQTPSESIPLEQTSAGRRDVRAENAVYFTDLNYVPDARRFDMGERDHFISMEMASIGMEMLAEWGASAVVQRIAMLTARIAEGVRGIGVNVPDARLRAPHILSLAFKGGMPAGLVEGLASAASTSRRAGAAADFAACVQ